MRAVKMLSSSLLFLVLLTTKLAAADCGVLQHNQSYGTISATAIADSEGLACSRALTSAINSCRASALVSLEPRCLALCQAQSSTFKKCEYKGFSEVLGAELNGCQATKGGASQFTAVASVDCEKELKCRCESAFGLPGKLNLLDFSSKLGVGL